MVFVGDISIVFMGFINQQTSQKGAPPSSHPSNVGKPRPRWLATSISSRRETATLPPIYGPVPGSDCVVPMFFAEKP